MNLSLWEWIKGPSVALSAIMFQVIWTTAGTFMLMFLASLQDLPVEVDEAAALDGTTNRQRLRYVTIPMIKPTILLVVTLGVIGTWQVFDQIYVMGRAATPTARPCPPPSSPTKPRSANQKWGSGAAMAFVVFAIIIVLTPVQRWVLHRQGQGQGKRVARSRGPKEHRHDPDRQGVPLRRGIRARHGVVRRRQLWWGTSGSKKIFLYPFFIQFAMIYIFQFDHRMVDLLQDPVGSPTRSPARRGRPCSAAGPSRSPSRPG